MSEPKYKVGDRVRINSKWGDGSRKGEEFVVTEVVPKDWTSAKGDTTYYRGDDRESGVWESYLDPAEPPYIAKDGDRVRVTIVVEGVYKGKGRGDYKIDDRWFTEHVPATFELIEPAESPTVARLRELGEYAVIAPRGDSEEDPYIKRGDKWLLRGDPNWDGTSIHTVADYIDRGKMEIAYEGLKA